MRHPQRSAVSGEAVGIPEAIEPSVRARVDERHHASEVADLHHEPVRPGGHLVVAEAVVRLDVEHRKQVAGFRVGDLDEELRFLGGIARGIVGPREVIRAHHHAVRARACAVRGEGGVDVVLAVGRLQEHEPLAGAGHLRPVDGALPVGNVDAGNRGPQAGVDRDLDVVACFARRSGRTIAPLRRRGPGEGQHERGRKGQCQDRTMTNGQGPGVGGRDGHRLEGPQGSVLEASATPARR